MEHIRKILPPPPSHSPPSITPRPFCPLTPSHLPLSSLSPRPLSSFLSPLRLRPKRISYCRISLLWGHPYNRDIHIIGISLLKGHFYNSDILTISAKFDRPPARAGVQGAAAPRQEDKEGIYIYVYIATYIWLYIQLCIYI